MNVKTLSSQKHLNPKTGCLCRYIRSDTEYFRPHNHDFYEIFMVIKGNVSHLINGKTQILKEGSLLFIRDFDVHDYKSADGNYFEFINLAFSKESFNAMQDYLGESQILSNLLKASLPPVFSLSVQERDKLFFDMTELSKTKKEAEIKLRLRILLVKIFAENFLNYPEIRNEVPLWLETTYRQMKEPSNFIEGVDRMYEICPKSREHLCRSLKKHYNTSPIRLVTDLRLEFCTALLTQSNLSVTQICYECGFTNLSWFYKIFCKKYNLTPSDYRNKHS